MCTYGCFCICVYVVCVSIGMFVCGGGLVCIHVICMYLCSVMCICVVCVLCEGIRVHACGVCVVCA